MNRQTVFEKLLSDLSSCLMSSFEKGVESNIHNALQNTLNGLGFQHLLLFQYASDSGSINMLHTACANGVAQLPDHLVPSQSFPWCHDQLQQGRVVRINSLQDFPPQATHDCKICRDHDIASVLAVPLRMSGVLRYTIAATASHPQTWSRYRVGQVRLLGTILASALERDRAVRGIHPSDPIWRRILENIPAAAWYIDRERRYRFVPV